DAHSKLPDDAGQLSLVADRPFVRDQEAECERSVGVARGEGHRTSQTTGGIAGPVGLPHRGGDDAALAVVGLAGPEDAAGDELAGRPGLPIELDSDHSAISGMTSRTKSAGTSTPFVVSLAATRHSNRLPGTANEPGRAGGMVKVHDSSTTCRSCFEHGRSISQAMALLFL